MNGRPVALRRRYAGLFLKQRIELLHKVRIHGQESAVEALVELFAGLLRATGNREFLEQGVRFSLLEQVAVAVILGPDEGNLAGEPFQEGDNLALLHFVGPGDLAV